MNAAIRRSLVAACVLLPLAAGAQGPPPGPPEPPKNLKFFPKDIPREQLIANMRRFTQVLGLRCNDCHVVSNPGEMPERLDFAADDKDRKKVARVMLNMVRDINDKYLAETGRTFTPRTRVTCETCHHGMSKPRTMVAELMDALEAKGADSAVARYKELREKTFGRAMYDFGEFSLPMVADEAVRSQRPDDAMRFLQLNLEFYPQSMVTYTAMAQGQAQRGDTTSAIATLNKALEIMPNNGQVRRMLSMLKGERPRQ